MRHSNITGLMKGLALAGIVCMTALPSLAEQRFDGATLRVATFGGSWKDSLAEVISPKFEALGGTIEYVTGSPQANLAKLIAARGNAPFDVMEILDAQVPDFQGSELLQKIDLSKVPNTTFLQDFQYSDMLVASWNTQETICYNTEKFAELGIPRPTTYSDLAVPALAGRLSIPDITSGGGLANFAGFAYAAGGDGVNVGPGLELIKSLNALKFWTRGGETVTQFGSGDIYAAVVHAGWCVRAKNAGSPVTTVHPHINATYTGVAKEGWLGILKSSDQAAAATWFINEYIDNDFQYRAALKNGVFPVNQAVIEKLKSDPVFAEMLELDAASIAKQLRVDYTKVSVSDWLDQWNRMVATQ
ncbi:MAG: extracellular solute-binding protein [Pseudomonadota bacterium]|nr:extracellular solute-binding protein [Pseudomonadota bacterium]